MARRWSIPFVSALVALLAVAVLATSLAPVSGAIPNPGDGRFYGCMVKQTGAVKLIDYPKVKGCPKGQRLIDWGRTGPQGPAGAGGAQGPGGPQGPGGASGSSRWADIADKPSDIEDGQIGWAEVRNKPADFADGIDDDHIDYWSQVVFIGAVLADDVETLCVGDMSPNVEIEFSVIPIDPGVPMSVEGVDVRRAVDGTLTHCAYVANYHTSLLGGFKLRLRYYADGIAPAAVKKAIKSAEVKIMKRQHR